jgi:LuxR family transcriptional regulator, maltose regulon positive regulatory protein
MDGVVQMGRDAARASELHPPEAPWQTPCFWLRGVSSHLTGHSERALPSLQEAVRRGAVVSPLIQTLALSQLALIAMEDQEWDRGSSLMKQAHDQVHRCGLIEYPSLLMVHAASALVHAHTGQVIKAQADADHAARLLSTASELPPWYEAQSRIVLARARIRLDDLTGVRALLDDASTFLERTPDAALLSSWLREAAAALRKASAEAMGSEWALTTAELRTLQFLPSHLSFREIGERIHVSSNTVKTQARAVYRKLDASSRAEAVERARRAGLLSGDSLPLTQ